MLGALSAWVGICAQDQPKPPASKSADDNRVHVNANVVRTPLGNNSNPTILKGNVILVHRDTTLKSDLVDYVKKTNIATSPGKVTISDPECDITGDKGTADFNKKIGTLEGSVTMLVKPKADPNTDKDSVRAKMTKPTTITCPKIEYQYKAKIATLTGGVNFKQKDRSASAQKAVYDGKQEILTLTGDVKGTDEDGQTFSAPAVKISLKKGDEWMEAENANATFKVDLSEENAPEKK